MFHFFIVFDKDGFAFTITHRLSLQNVNVVGGTAENEAERFFMGIGLIIQYMCQIKQSLV